MPGRTSPGEDAKHRQIGGQWCAVHEPSLPHTDLQSFANRNSTYGMRPTARNRTINSTGWTVLITGIAVSPSASVYCSRIPVVGRNRAGANQRATRFAPCPTIHSGKEVAGRHKSAKPTLTGNIILLGVAGEGERTGTDHVGIPAVGGGGEPGAVPAALARDGASAGPRNAIG